MYDSNIVYNSDSNTVFNSNAAAPAAGGAEVRRHLARFSLDPLDRTFARVEPVRCGRTSVRRYTNEFWPAGQRLGSSLHEVAYRACFKPALPRFFVLLLSTPGDTIYDPFSGRGTTALEAALLGRRPLANDINPLSRILSEPRLWPPEEAALRDRLRAIRRSRAGRCANETPLDLSMFYHPDTEAEILALRSYLRRRRDDGAEDALDRWIRMVATNRLSGHSPGFFSVYTLPPNQAVTPERQIRINRLRRQRPEYRDTHTLIVKKSLDLTKRLDAADLERLRRVRRQARFYTHDARAAPFIRPRSVQLTVTSPPFLNVIHYATDNWLRCWFNAIDVRDVGGRITTVSTIPAWTATMSEVFRTLFRVTKPGGWVAFEVGEVRGGTVRLDEHVVPLGCAAGFRCEAILVNEQEFTKTANIWGVTNNRKGTNTNRVVLFRREG